MSSIAHYDRSHVLDMPRRFMVMRGIQLGIGCILFLLGIVGMVYIPNLSGLLLIVSGLITIVTGGYTIGSERAKAAKSYNYWAILVLESILVLFWLITFALTALFAAAAGFASDYYDGESEIITSLFACMAVAAALGAIEFVLYLTSLIILSMRIHRHRRAGGRCKPFRSTSVGVGHNAPEVYNALPQSGTEYKLEMQPQAYPVPQHPQGPQQYQPVHQQQPQHTHYYQ